MKTVAKILLVIALVWAVALSTLAVGTWYVLHRTGWITVHVSEREWDGGRHTVRIYVPAVFANLAIRAMPIAARIADHEQQRIYIEDHDRVHWHHTGVRTWHRGWHHGGAQVWVDDEDLRKWLPAIRAAADELERYPNATFVDVLDGREHVRVMTRGGTLVIEAHDQDQDVTVEVPARTVSLALRAIQDM